MPRSTQTPSAQPPVTPSLAGSTQQQPQQLVPLAAGLRGKRARRSSIVLPARGSVRTHESPQLFHDDEPPAATSRVDSAAAGTVGLVDTPRGSAAPRKTVNDTVVTLNVSGTLFAFRESVLRQCGCETLLLVAQDALPCSLSLNPTNTAGIIQQQPHGASHDATSSSSPRDLPNATAAQRASTDGVRCATSRSIVLRPGASPEGDRDDAQPSQPSWLAARLPRDDAGHVYLDRSADVFRVIANAVRGYALQNVDPDLMQLARADAAALGIAHVLDAHRPLTYAGTFCGGGSSADGLRLSSTTVVACATPMLRHGIVRQSFLIEEAEYVGIGVISRAVERFDAEFHTVTGCAVLYMTGTLHYSYPEHVREDTVCGFGQGAVVTVEVDFARRHVSWLRNGALVKTVRFDVPELAVAVILRRRSAVQMVSEP